MQITRAEIEAALRSGDHENERQLLTRAFGLSAGNVIADYRQRIKACGEMLYGTQRVRITHHNMNGETL